MEEVKAALRWSNKLFLVFQIEMAMIPIKAPNTSEELLQQLEEMASQMPDDVREEGEMLPSEQNQAQARIAIGQRKKRCSIDSSVFRKREHTEANWMPVFFYEQ